MGKVIGGQRAEAFFGDWRSRIQQNYTFPLEPEVSQALKTEYRAWYKTNLDIERTDAHAQSALANCNPAKAAAKKVRVFVYFVYDFRVCCCCLSALTSSTRTLRQHIASAWRRISSQKSKRKAVHGRR